MTVTRAPGNDAASPTDPAHGTGAFTRPRDFRMQSVPRANRFNPTVFGRDRVGIIAAVAIILADAIANALPILGNVQHLDRRVVDRRTA